MHLNAFSPRVKSLVSPTPQVHCQTMDTGTDACHQRAAKCMGAPHEDSSRKQSWLVFPFSVRPPHPPALISSGSPSLTSKGKERISPGFAGEHGLFTDADLSRSKVPRQFKADFRSRFIQRDMLSEEQGVLLTEATGYVTCRDVCGTASCSVARDTQLCQGGEAERVPLPSVPCRS